MNTGEGTTENGSVAPPAGAGASYGRGGRGAHITWTLMHSPLGRILVAGTERGLCFVSLGEDGAALEAGLRAEYPAAALVRDDSAMPAWRASVAAALVGEPADVPLDVQATAFQWRVWEALRAIPRGETRTYGQIAQAIGQPSACRAVGAACGANPVSLVIPCHRAVGSTGRLAGYRWGTGRKERLLALERQGAPTAG